MEVIVQYGLLSPKWLGRHAGIEQRAMRVGGALLCALCVAVGSSSWAQEKVIASGEPAMVNLPSDGRGQAPAGSAALSASAPAGQAASAANVDLGSASAGGAAPAVRMSGNTTAPIAAADASAPAKADAVLLPAQSTATKQLAAGAPGDTAAGASPAASASAPVAPNAQ
jgi:hypothetical protein